MKNNICLLANSKGGSGGSTLISFLATLFATNYKLKVLIIDAHTCQHSLYDCRDHELRDYPYLKPLYEIVKVDSKDVIVYLTSLKQDYDTIFIDWSGRVGLDDYFNNIVFSANIVIVPMIAWDINIEPTLSYIKYIRTIQNKKIAMGSDLKLFGIITMYNKRIKEHRDLWKIAKDNNITTFNTSIRKSVEYIDYNSTIVPVTDTESKIAKHEMIKLTREIIEVLN